VTVAKVAGLPTEINIYIEKNKKIKFRTYFSFLSLYRKMLGNLATSVTKP
jgi:hypothetical protein